MRTILRRLQFFYLAYFSKPKNERIVYQAIRRHRVRSILEIGIGTGRRARQMIGLAKSVSPGTTIRYAGIDLFEGRDSQDGPGLSLKAAYRLLKSPGVRVRLIPGDPLEALTEVANTLVGTQLIVIQANLRAESLERAWFFIPRTMAQGCTVLLDTSTADGVPGAVVPLDRETVERRAVRPRRRLAA
jgi:hypothetical protein